ncbi:MAG: hypothetical protein KGJ09_06760 [Candidatus Omnitrophica bacterium]|nr:hypothetical protein [Candidatus Omnitrophota bacterium]MDE2009765.1 hypothetical protein [Candidatus Omnitrophota bacterium]MDE2213840.1 hypothetical protein [Candidatus Omnitrophota bacterium]MDE2232373.1 hypothetical protein [Candidatus Omnitrophota bacterium]
MTSKSLRPKPFAVLNSSISILFQHPIIFYPLVISVFFQLLALEIFYFAPRPPLSVFFAPLISRLWGPEFLHYPYNFLLLPKLFYYAQVVIYLFAGGFLLAVSIRLIGAFNNDKKMSVKEAWKDCWPSYIHVLLASFLSFFLFFAFAKSYNNLYIWAAKIQAKGGVHGFIKHAILGSGLYVQFLVGILITAVLIYVIPIIVLEKKKIFPAIGLGLKFFWQSFWFTIVVVLVPTLFYLPVLLARDKIPALMTVTFPEIELVVLVVSTICATLVDCIIAAAVTTYYLYTKENPARPSA